MFTSHAHMNSVPATATNSNSVARISSGFMVGPLLASLVSDSCDTFYACLFLIMILIYVFLNTDQNTHIR